MPDAWWEDQIAHGTNVFMFRLFRHMMYTLNNSGELIESPQFTELDRHIGARQETNGWLVLDWGFHVSTYRFRSSDNLKVFDFLSNEWITAFQEILEAVQTHLEATGVPRDRILHYIYDERQDMEFKHVAHIIRSMNPEYQIFNTQGVIRASIPISKAVYEDIKEYVDVWCSWFPVLHQLVDESSFKTMTSSGKPVWFYDASPDQRAWSPYTKYRYKFWLAFMYGLDGCTYWKHQGDNVGTAYYPLVGEWPRFDEGPPVTSRRYEAWFSGLQDYKLLRKLEDLANSSSRLAPEAQGLLSEAVQAVYDDQNNLDRAEKYRRRIIMLLDLDLLRSLER